jgi:hypothetical protein
MAWVPIETSGIEFTFVENSDFGGSVSLVSSVAIKDQGTPPSGGAIADWQFNFVYTVGREPINLRITPISYAAAAPGDVAFTVQTEDGLVVVQTIPNTSITPETSWEPNPVEVTIDFTLEQDMVITTGGEYDASTSQFLIEVEVPDPPVSEPCEELGRVSRAYVSAHTRTRIHSMRLYPNEKRCLVADFNGAIPPSRSIVQAQWRMEVASSVGMSAPTIAGRAAQVMIQAAYRGCVGMKCQVTLDNGEVYNQLFVVEVMPGPYFGDENTVAGPTILTVTA